MKTHLVLALAGLCLLGLPVRAEEPPQAQAFLADERPASSLKPDELLRRIMDAKLLSMQTGISPEARAEIEKRRMEAVVAYQEAVK